MRGRYIAGIALVALTLAGCAGVGANLGGRGFNTFDGGDESLIGPGPLVGTPVPPAIRYGAMDKVRAKYDALVTARVKANIRELQLLTYMKTLPEFTTAGLSPDGTLFGRFADNSYYLFNDRSVPDDFTPPGSRPEAPGSGFVADSAPSVQPKGAETTGTEVVNSKKAFVFDTFDGSMGTPNEELIEMLQKRGYQVTGGQATLEALRTVNNAGAFYISSHGAHARHPTNPNLRFWSVWSSTKATPENDLKYMSDIAAGRLVVFEAAYGKSLGPFKYVERRYAITADWVKYYQWSFSSKSLAFINCCWSDKGGFTTALRSLPKPVSTTFGWDNAAHPDKAWRVSRYLFDRALGSNLAEPILVGGARPFPTDDVFAKEEELGYTDGSTADYGPAKLIKAGANLLLAPSVMRMEVFERGLDPSTVKPRLFIFGNLGTTPPQSIKIGGTPVGGIAVISENEWRCDLPSAPGAPGFSGRVEITSAAGIKSNTPLITSWQGVFQYRSAPLTVHASLRSTIDVPVAYRADMHRYRTTVDGDLLMPSAAYARSASTEAATFNYTNPMPGMSWTKAPTGKLPFGLRGAPAPYGTGHIVDAKFDRKQGTASFAFSFLGTDVYYTIPPAPQVFTIVMHRDMLLLTTVPTGTDKFGAPVYTTRSIGQLRPDFKVPRQVFNGAQLATHGNQLECYSLTPTFIPSERCEEDWPN